MESDMKKMICLWNWPKTSIDPVEVNYLSYLASESEEYTFSLLEEITQDLGFIDRLNHSLLDNHVRSSPEKINTQESNIYNNFLKSTRPSRYSTTIQLGDFFFSDRSHNYPWIHGILKRIKTGIDLTNEGYSHIVFISTGLIPSENFPDRLGEILGKAELESRDMVVFRNGDRDIVPDFFVVNRKVGQDISRLLESGLHLPNFKVEEFVEDLSYKYPNVHSLSSEFLNELGRWERPTFSLSLDDDKISQDEKSHIINSLSINCPYFLSNPDGSFEISHLAVNMDRNKEMEFTSRITLYSNPPGNGGQGIVLHHDLISLPPRQWKSSPNIGIIVPDPNSYIEVQTSVSYNDTYYLHENYNILNDFLSLHSFFGIKQFYKKTK